MRERLQGYLTNTNFSIKVAKIDASAAITELKQQIRTEVMGLSASTTGAGGTVLAPNVAAAQKEQPTGAFEDTLARLESALANGDSRGMDAAMGELRDTDGLGSGARELYMDIYDALMMDDAEKALEILRRRAS